MSTNRRFGQIGLDRLVRLKWLERTANLALAGNDARAAKIALQEHLQGSFQSNNVQVRGSMDKTITILMRIWIRPPSGLQSLQRAGLHLLAQLPKEDSLAVHWGMITAVYPFWGVVAAHVGRLLRLQGNAVASQVQRRVREQYGERETVSRRVRYVLRSFVDWGVSQETSEPGVYTAGSLHSVADAKLAAWLVEAFLHAHPTHTAPLKMVLDSPSLFPFRLSPLSADHMAASSGRLEVLRHGLDQEMLMLRG